MDASGCAQIVAHHGDELLFQIDPLGAVQSHHVPRKTNCALPRTNASTTEHQSMSHLSSPPDIPPDDLRSL